MYNFSDLKFPDSLRATNTIRISKEYSKIYPRYSKNPVSSLYNQKSICLLAACFKVSNVCHVHTHEIMVYTLHIYNNSKQLHINEWNKFSLLCTACLLRIRCNNVLTYTLHTHWVYYCVYMMIIMKKTWIYNHHAEY